MSVANVHPGYQANAVALAREKLAVRRLYWTTFAIRFGFGLSAWICTQFFHLSIMEDAATYSTRAAEIAQAWLSGGTNEWLTGAIAEGRQAWLMVVVLAIFYLFCGGAEIIPFALGCYCLLTSITPVLAYRASRLLGMPHRSAMVTGALVAYTPAFAIWSSALYKEGLVLIAMYWVIINCMRLQSDFRLQSVVMLGVAFLALFGLRFYMGGIMMGSLAIGLTMGRNDARAEKSMPPIFRQLFLLGFMVIIFVALGVSSSAEKLVSGDLNDMFEKIDNSRKDLARSPSGYLRETDVSTPWKALRFMPEGIIYFMAVPLPWHISTFRQNIAIPETFFWLVVVYPFAIRGVMRGLKKNMQGTLFLLLSAVLVTCFYSIYIGNIGTAYRMRIQVWAILAIFAGWGWHREGAAVPLSRQVLKKSPALLR